MRAEIVIVGGGAAGMFAAAILAENTPQTDVLVLEGAAQPLNKVRLSGGGRCNLTHACGDIALFREQYPRGGKALIGPLHRFGPEATRDWFEKHGVQLVTESDGRVFPRQGGSAAVIDALMRACRRGNFRLLTNSAVRSVNPSETGIALSLEDGRRVHARGVLIACGGGTWFDGLSHTIESWAPSLFTFRTDDKSFIALAGVTVPRVRLSVMKRQAEGAMLITHQGISGPAVLECSALVARELASAGYCSTLSINWAPDITPERVLDGLTARRAASPRQQIASAVPFELPARLWRLLVERAGQPGQQRWSEASAKALRALAAQVCEFTLPIVGRVQNRTEFVTCGGVRLSEVDFRTMRSRRHSDIFLAGEVLDIDGLTGGYNLQAAWTTGYLAAMGLLATVARDSTTSPVSQSPVSAAFEPRL